MNDDYKCGPRTRSLTAHLDARKDAWVQWCPETYRPRQCGNLRDLDDDGSTRFCKHNGGLCPLSDGTIRCCCHYGFDGRDDGERELMPDLTGSGISVREVAY